MASRRRFAAYALMLILIEVFAGDIIFGHFASANFSPLVFSGAFNTRYYAGLEGVAFFQQLVNAFRIGALDIGQALQISRLLARVRSRCFREECR